MPEKILNEIPRDLREFYQKGTLALQRQNFDYAIAILNQVLQREPAFFDCRQALRVTQFKKSGGSKGLFRRMLGGASTGPLVARAQMSLRKDPLEAISIAEQALNSDPDNAGAHRVLAEAALDADLPKTACLSLEILLKNDPNDYDLLMLYARALARSGQGAKAEGIYSDLMRAYPNKPEVAQALKDVSASHTMAEGGYDALADGTGSYRDILANKEEAVSLEQERREVKSDDVAGRLIRDYEARVAQEPRNLKLLRSIAELYAQKREFGRALEYCERISKEGGNEPAFERFKAEIIDRKFEHELAQLDPQAPDYPSRKDAITAERDAFRIAECKSRADRYPTDLQIRFELGELYFQAGRISEAIQEFQKAQAYPSRKVQSLGYLGQCFARRGMNDLAVRTLQNAIKEKPSLDDEKKELVYNLGSVLEKMGRKEEAIEQFKQIYEVDIGYRDVGTKVDAYYSGT